MVEKPRIRDHTERSVWWILSLVDVTFFIQNIMVFACLHFGRSKSQKRKHRTPLQNIAFGENTAAKSRKLQGFRVSNFRIVSFFEKVSIKYFEPPKEVFNYFS